jgi:site-specific DNA-methyltransferase (adenine-specific)
MNPITVKISEVKSNPNNPRIIKDDKFQKLVKSIKEFPEMLNIRPIVVNADMIVLGGNMRLKACKEAGLKEVAIIKAEDLTEDQQKQFIIKDNVGFGEWDWEDLANNWDAEQLTDWGLDIPDFKPEVLEAEEDEFDVPDGGIDTDIVLGDLFEIGEHRLLCGDSTDSDQVAKLMNGQKADMVFTDPPYGVSYEGNSNPKTKNAKNSGESMKIMNDSLDGQNLVAIFRDSLLNAFLNTSDKAAFYIWYATSKSIETLTGINESGLKIRSFIFWYKIDSPMSAFMSQYIPNYEPMVYCYKDNQSPNWYGPTNETCVWEQQIQLKDRVHPTQKPVKLPQRAIKNSSKINETVLDLFLGSGSTMVASHQLKRKCYGMELDPKYCQVIVDRMMKLDPTLEVKRNGEKYTKTMD